VVLTINPNLTGDSCQFQAMRRAFRISRASGESSGRTCLPGTTVRPCSDTSIKERLAPGSTVTKVEFRPPRAPGGFQFDDQTPVIQDNLFTITGMSGGTPKCSACPPLAPAARSDHEGTHRPEKLAIPKKPQGNRKTAKVVLAKDNNFFSEATERKGVRDDLIKRRANLKPDGGCCMLQPSQDAVDGGFDGFLTDQNRITA
jgi:hypothetical protein